MASDSPPMKRPRDATGDLARAAEIVMVLSATAAMRGGGEPMAAEAALVIEARRRLAGVCEGARPKDLVAREAVRTVAEDLGLNRSQNPVMGFRPTKMSIAERVLLTKRKMEESKEAAMHSAVQSSQNQQMVQGVSFEAHGTIFPATTRFTHGKPPVSFSAGMAQKSSSAMHVPALGSAVPFKQPHVNEPRAGATPTKSAPSLSVVLPHTEAAQLNGPTHTTQARATTDQTNKLVNNISTNSEVNDVQLSSQVMRIQDGKTLAMQAGPVNLVGQQAPQGPTFISRPSILTNHSDIAENVQQLLQPRFSNHPSWTPPSTEYMNKPLNCQVCRIIVTDVESLLVCDNCEGPTHLKCLQSFVNKETPKAEWHCTKCLMLSNGKPLPPKYGKVTRAIGTPKIVPNAGVSHSSPERRAEGSGIKDNQQKLLANRGSSLSNATVANNTAHVQGELAWNTGTLGAETKAYFSVSATEREDVICAKTLSNHQDEGVGPASVSVGTQSEVSLNHANNSGLSPCIASSTLESSSQSMGVSKSERSQIPSKIEAEQHCHSTLQGEGGATLSNHQKDEAVMCAKRPKTLANKQEEEDGLVSSCIGTQSINSLKHSQDSGSSPCTVSSSSESISEVDSISKSASSQDPSNSDAQQTNQSQVPSEPTVKNDLKANGDVEPSVGQSEAINEPVACKLSNARSYDGSNHRTTPNEALECNDNDVSVSSVMEIHPISPIDWVGGAFEVVDGKTYYRSCSIDGTSYTLQDHVLIASDGHKRFPSKLKSMWDDNESGSKWAIVEPYCFPGDIPESVSQPSNSEDSEVYASNNQKAIMVGSICGPCEVLLIDKFREETKRRSQVADKNSSLCPIFLCKWKYDESRSIFESITT